MNDYSVFYVTYFRIELFTATNVPSKCWCWVACCFTSELNWTSFIHLQEPRQDCDSRYSLVGTYKTIILWKYPSLRTTRNNATDLKNPCAKRNKAFQSYAYCASSNFPAYIRFNQNNARREVNVPQTHNQDFLHWPGFTSQKMSYNDLFTI